MIVRRWPTDALARPCATDFLDELFDHCREHRPEFLDEHGQAGTREAIAADIARAARYGIFSRHGAAAFVKLMFLLGTDYATDPDILWAPAILAKDDFAGEADKLAALVDAAREDVTGHAAA